MGLWLPFAWKGAHMSSSIQYSFQCEHATLVRTQPSSMQVSSESGSQLFQHASHRHPSLRGSAAALQGGVQHGGPVHFGRVFEAPDGASWPQIGGSLLQRIQQGLSLLAHVRPAAGLLHPTQSTTSGWPLCEGFAVQQLMLVGSSTGFKRG